MRDRKGKSFCVSCEKELSKKPIQTQAEKVSNKEEPVSKHSEKLPSQMRPLESKKSVHEQQKPAGQSYTEDQKLQISTTSTKDATSNSSGIHYCSVQDLDQQILLLYKSTIYKAVKEIHDRRDVSNQEKAGLIKQFLNNHGM